VINARHAQAANKMTSGEMIEATARRKSGRQKLQALNREAVDGPLNETAEPQVYRGLRPALMSSFVAPSVSQTSRSLALELKTSAQPVRDARKQLKVDGIPEG
jgi:hypothetical protein